jgi:DNA invertase Pin-like site-specific DNA recombinase
MRPKAYSYIRFSTSDQRKGDSLRRQIELSERYAEEHGLMLDNSLRLRDLGVSAYSGKHRSDKGALGQFLKLVEEGKIEKGSVLLVESFDRLSRQEIITALQQFLDIIRKGIKIVTLIDNREYTEGTVNANVGELIVSLSIMSRAHEESATKSKRLKAAWVGKRKQTETMKLTARCPAWLKLNEAKTEFIHVEGRKEVICRIFEMKLAGKGATTIVRELNSNPEIWKPGSTKKRKQGAGWRESYVKKILQSRSVIGEFQPHQLLNGKREPIGEVIPDYYPTVIDKDVFYRVQEQFRQNNHKGGRTGKVTNLFSHIAKCGYCGSSMAFVNKGHEPKGGKYLVCDQARRRSIDCSNVFIRYDEIERLVLTYCKGLQPKDILTENNDTAITLLKGQLDAKASELKSIIVEIENITDSVSTTKDKRVRSMLEKRMIERFDTRDSLTLQITNLKQQIDTLSRSSEDTQLTLASLKELLSYLKTAETKKLVEVRLKLRNEIRKLISSINFYPLGSHRLTTKDAKNILNDMSKVILKDEDPVGYALIKEDLRRRVESPKDFRHFIINFTSGSRRIIRPESKLPLRRDVDKERGFDFVWHELADGKIICEEYLKDRIKITHYRRSIGLNNEEIFEEYFDDQCKEFNRLAEQENKILIPYLNRL